uniref:Uncharacterized protein n=1 Tax=Rhizophora mucronata TaxID=61149 RepID=A0A2P2JVH0_RHIMU
MSCRRKKGGIWERFKDKSPSQTPRSNKNHEVWTGIGETLSKLKKKDCHFLKQGVTMLKTL